METDATELHDATPNDETQEQPAEPTSEDEMSAYDKIDPFWCYLTRRDPRHQHTDDPRRQSPK